MYHLTKERKKVFFTSLLTHNFTEAGRAIGLGAVYNTDNSIRTNSYKLYKTLDPVELGISEDVIQAVKLAIENRKMTTMKVQTEGEGGDVLDPTDSKSIVIGGKNKAALLLHKKMDRMLKNKKLLDDVSLSQLATTFGILFDKSQIIKGEATENIAVMAKIDKNLSPEDALNALLKMRENITATE